MTSSPWATDPARLRAALAVYLVADPEQSASGDLVADVAAAIAGGTTCIQLRAKHLTDLDAYHLATRVAALCREGNVPFFVNDRLDVALAVGADGVHIGVTDLPIHVIRHLGENRLLIGWSPETDAQIAGAALDGAHYLGLGPVFKTASKADAGDAIGPDGLANRIARTDLPVVGIGGITARTAASVIKSGSDGVAVVSAILRASAPHRAAAELRSVVDAARGATAG